jgi:hypothetical protein
MHWIMGVLVLEPLPTTTHEAMRPCCFILFFGFLWRHCTHVGVQYVDAKTKFILYGFITAATSNGEATTG